MQMVLSSDNECKQITCVIQIESRLLMYVGFVGSYELEEDDVRYKDDCEILHKAGFTEVKMARLSKLPRNTAEKADTWNWWIIVAFNLSAGWLPPASSQNKLFRE